MTNPIDHDAGSSCLLKLCLALDGDEFPASMARSLLLSPWGVEARTFLTAYFSEFRPETIYETGTHHGVSAAFLAALASGLGYTPHILTFDICDSLIKDRLWQRLGVNHSIQFLRQSATRNALEAFCRASGKGKVDFAFIDGDHRYEGAEADYRAGEPFFDGTLVLMDNMTAECGRFFKTLNPIWFHREMAVKPVGEVDRSRLHKVFRAYSVSCCSRYLETPPQPRFCAETADP